MTNNPTQVEPVEGLADRLERLASLATQGAWEIQDGCSWRRIGTQGRDGNVLHPATYSSTDRHPDLSAGRGEDVYANLHLIVALQNNLPTIIAALRSSTVNDELVAMLVADPVDVSAGIPEHLIEVGMAVLDRVDEDNRNYVSGETTDWDTGMVAAAVFKAMLRAALAKINGGEE